jgi:hypothetical protein
MELPALPMGDLRVFVGKDVIDVRGSVCACDVGYFLQTSVEAGGIA